MKLIPVTGISLFFVMLFSLFIATTLGSEEARRFFGFASGLLLVIVGILGVSREYILNSWDLWDSRDSVDATPRKKKGVSTAYLIFWILFVRTAGSRVVITDGDTIAKTESKKM